jgi:exopolysaccharide biosynthesis polyprenyl glycosylphosphotransferase
VLTVTIDVLAATAAVVIGVLWAASDPSAYENGEYAVPIWLTALFVPTVIALLGARSLYRRRLDRRVLDEVGPIETTITVAAVLLLTVLVSYYEETRPGPTVVRVWICAAVLMAVGRLIHATSQRRHRRSDNRLAAPTLIVGNGRVAHQIIERLAASPEYGLAPVGLLDVESPHSGTESALEPDTPYIGSPDAIEEAVLNTGAECIVIAFSRVPDELLTTVVRVAHRKGLRVWVVPRMFDIIGERARFDHIGGLPLLALPYTNPHGWQFTGKHVIDRVLSALGILAISPVFLTLMVLVRLSSPGPIFFRQERVGRDGRVFDCLKFRSMRPPLASDADFELQSGAAPGGVEGVDRRTKIGRFMRSTSLDELPQLINVLKGEMSLVGPRPERAEFVELFEIQIRRYGDRHRVKAGVTGWAQVHGLRGQTSIADRAEWDNYYIENFSLALDIKILALTVLAVFRGAE